MHLLANLKLRKKLFVALAPVAAIVIFAGIYASGEENQQDDLTVVVFDFKPS